MWIYTVGKVRGDARQESCKKEGGQSEERQEVNASFELWGVSSRGRVIASSSQTLAGWGWHSSLSQ